MNVRNAVRRETLAGVRPGRGREMGGGGEGALRCDESDIDEAVGDGCSFAGIPCIVIAIAGVTAGDQTPAKARTGWSCGVAGFGGRLRNQTGSSGGSSLATQTAALNDAVIGDSLAEVDRGEYRARSRWSTALRTARADGERTYRQEDGLADRVRPLVCHASEHRARICVSLSQAAKHVRVSRKRKATALRTHDCT